MKRMRLSVGILAVLGIVGTAWADGNAQAGKARSGSCTGCHGAAGEGIAPSPALAGMKTDRFKQAMKEYKSGKRDNSIMKTFATQLNEGDVEDLAAYYASLKGK